MKKPVINVHPNGVVIRSHNKKTIISVHPEMPDTFIISITKKYDGPGKSCDFTLMRRNVGRAQLGITKESLDDLVYAYSLLLKRLRAEELAKSERVVNKKKR
jgi:hypothetical protein